MQFQGKTFEIGTDGTNPIRLKDYAHCKKDSFKNFVAFLNKMSYYGLLKSKSERLVIIADDQYVN